MRPKLSQQSNDSSNVASSSNNRSTGGIVNTNIHSVGSIVGASLNAAVATSSGIINPVFVSDLVESSVIAPTRPPPPIVPPKPSKHPQQQHRHSNTSTTPSESCSESTVVTSASDNRRTLTTSSLEIGDHHSSEQWGSNEPARHRRHHASPHSDQCQYCYRFHVNNHRAHKSGGGGSDSVPSGLHHESHSPPGVFGSSYSSSYAPYPPQWYYLLAADTKQFRKHKHSHYRRDCKVCRQIVRQTFEQYYLRNNNPNMTTALHASDSVDSGSLVPVSLMSDHHSDPLLDSAISGSSPLPLVFLPRRRANCGHSCLKYSILFYCSVAVILAICFICYLTKVFGYFETMPSLPSDPTVTVTSLAELSANQTVESVDQFNVTTTMANLLTMESNTSVPAIATSSSVFDMVRIEVLGIVVCSALMIIFFLGLIGAFLESILCLRIFGAILSYLFLLTFGAALYIIILLVISRVPAKLVLSTVSCSAVAITLHAALAIAPFAFADLIYQEKQDDKNELSSTYVKYPSVRFLPSGAPSGPFTGGKGRRSQFSLPFLSGSGWASRAWLGPRVPVHSGAMSGSRPSSSIPNSSSRTSPVNLHQQQPDNLSSEGLLPPSSHHHQNTSVRFHENWI